MRTYITVVAGVTRMDRRRFLLWSLVGAVLWVVSISLLGYFLGATVPCARREHRLAIIVILAFSVIPVVFEWWRHRARRRRPRRRQDGGPDRDIMSRDRRLSLTDRRPGS